jgi:hypothetical protein
MNCIERVLLFLKNIWGDFISFIDRLFIAVVYCVFICFLLKFSFKFYHLPCLSNFVFIYC